MFSVDKIMDVFLIILRVNGTNRDFKKNIGTAQPQHFYDIPGIEKSPGYIRKHKKKGKRAGCAHGI